MAKLSEAQFRKLASVPDEWEDALVLGDHRPIPPLHRAKMIEFRETEVRNYGPGVRVVRREWRRTDAGRAALSEKEAER